VSKLNEAEKINVGLLKDNERLQNELNALITKMTGLEESHKNTLEEKQLLQQNFHGLLKQKEAEIHTAVLESEKKISNLEGQLATYKSLDKTEN